MILEEIAIKRLTFRFPDCSFDMFTGSGVFSKSSLDNGTSVLLRHMQIKPKDRVLDLGCGIGTVGVYVKKKNPEAEVILSDTNERAVFLAKKNLKLYHLDCPVIISDVFSKIDGSFDVILLNPPQAAGKDVCFAMIEGAARHLVPNGSLQLVARHAKGGASFEKKMSNVFGNVSQIGKKSGFTVYKSILS
ncbi:MAG: class I SAM-dependent methyltransferase [Nanoarchaeota archaeon]|nr:class I SAM-dependent methyltransferase [Nanoarchaeota archaeon]